MNKTAIKNFSIWARNKLIADVSYRAGLMGITANGIDKPLPQSTATAEFYHIGTKEPYQISGEAISQRRRLVEVMERKAQETDYATAYHYVLEEVAYTWFNRLIAIRFMEVNDYLPSHIRVLSSETGKLEPDLVTTPFDTELDFTGGEKDAILRMQRDNDVDGLFHLLFIKQCNALNAILPGLFEKTNDFTELLLNLSVIDREGVVYRLVHDIDEDDFSIEQEDGVEIIGWLYQYWNTEPKAAVFGRASGTKIKKEEIPAATQLFTPHWIVRYMVENSLGRLWVEGHPNDDLKSRWTYYLDEAEQEPDVQAKLAEMRKEYAALNPEDIRCIDPCCGSGHILAYLFDVLVQIYESRGYSARDAAQSIVRYNLHGLDIDKRAAQLAYFSVMMKARQYDRRFFTRNLQPMVYSTTGDEDGENFGSLVKVDDPGTRPEDPQTIFEQVDYEKRLNAWSYRYLLAQKYHVVVTNPPYMGSSGMNPKLNEFVRSSYPSTKYDLSTAFMEKTLEMCDSHGFMAMINIPVWMFLSSFERMRNHLISCHTFSTMLHFGRGVFGSDFGTTAFVIQKKVVTNYTAKYFKLYDRQGEVEPISVKEEKFLGGHGLYQMQQNKFLNLPGSQIAYWIPSKVYDAFALDKEEKLKIFTKSGLTTGDNEKFLKHWSEIHFNHIYHTWQDDSVIPVWYAHLKGGDFRKWYGNYDYVIQYDVVALADMKKCPGFRHDGKEYFFKESVTWSKTTAGPLSARIKETLNNPKSKALIKRMQGVFAGRASISYHNIRHCWGDLCSFP